MFTASLLMDTLSSKICRWGSTALELDGIRNTKIYTGSGRELCNTLRPVWSGTASCLIYSGGQGYMESPNRVQLES